MMTMTMTDDSSGPGPHSTAGARRRDAVRDARLGVGPVGVALLLVVVVAFAFARVDAMDAREEEPLQRLVFGLAEDLLSFDFSETFVSAFEVSNKVIEMLMLRAGIDVCCVGEEDVTRADRYEASLRASTE